MFWRMHLACISFADQYSAGLDCWHFLGSMLSPTCPPYKFKQHSPSHLSARVQEIWVWLLRSVLLIPSVFLQAPPCGHVQVGPELALHVPLRALNPMPPIPCQSLVCYVPSRVCLPMGPDVGGYGTAVSVLLLLDRGLWMLSASDLESPQYGLRASTPRPLTL